MLTANTRDPAVRDCLDAAIAEAAPHIRPLLAAVRDAGVNLAQVPQGTGAFDFPNNRPLITLIGDDYEQSLGPDAFDSRSLRKLFKRSDLAVIVSGAPDISLYTATAGVAVVIRRNVVLIETRPEHEAEWADLVRQAQPAPALVISTPKGPSGARH